MPFTFFAPSTPAASASDLDSLLGAANNITHFPALGAGDNVIADNLDPFTGAVNNFSQFPPLGTGSNFVSSFSNSFSSPFNSSSFGLGLNSTQVLMDNLSATLAPFTGSALFAGTEFEGMTVQEALLTSNGGVSFGSSPADQALGLTRGFFNNGANSSLGGLAQGSTEQNLFTIELLTRGLL